MKYMTCLSMNTISLPLLACWHTCSYRRPEQKKIVKFEHAYHGNTWCTEINQLLISCWNVKEMKSHVCSLAIEYWMPVVEKNFKTNAEVGWDPEWNRIWEWSMTRTQNWHTLLGGTWVCFLLIYMQIQVLELGQEVPGKTTSEKRSRADREFCSLLLHTVFNIKMAL